MQRQRRRGPLVVITLLLVALARAQTPPPAPVLVPGQRFILVNGQPQGVPAGQEGATAAQPAANPNAPAEQQAAQRIQKLQQVQFDRRPSVRLKVWATPPGAPPAANAESPAPTEAKAAPPSEVQTEPGTGMEIVVQEVPAEGESSGEAQPETTPADAKPPEAVPAKPPAPDPFDAEIAAWQRNVTLGNWPEVKTFLAGLVEAERKVAYPRMLAALAAPLPPDPRTQQPFGAQFAEKHVFGFDDVIALAWVAPQPLDDAALKGLGQILNASLQQGNLLERFVDRLRSETAKPEAERTLTTRQAAKLLMAGGHALEAGGFLPAVEEAIANQDHEGLLLSSFHCLAQYAKEPKTEHLERAWSSLQAIFAATEIDAAIKQKLLEAAVALAPRVRADLGKTWLEESFTKNPERGMEILASIGGAAALALQMQPADTEPRRQGLELQATAVHALLAAAPERADAWRGPLGLLAGNWLREAEVSYQHDRSTSLGPTLQRDPFGNFFYVNYEDWGSRPQPGQLAGVRVAEVLELRPNDAWLARVDDSLRPKLAMVTAQLYLKVREEDKAFPFIEEMAKTHPDRAKELVKEYLRVWTSNHDPNDSRRRTNPYMFMYGYEQRAEGIPLTRSKQERNLQELAELVKRLRSLPLGEPDEDLLAKAFMACHSSAEVYQLAALENVFGAVGGLKPKTLATLAETMRTNLSGQWREPAVQERSRTKRKPKQISDGVIGGYKIAQAMLDGALAKHPDDWSLRLARATLRFDENSYYKELSDRKADSAKLPEEAKELRDRNAGFAKRREEAFVALEQAADLYAAQVGKLAKEEETTKVYEHWLYASLGAADLAALDQDSIPDLRQPAKIRAKLLALPGEASERHLALMANTLFTRLSAVNPAVKFRYLRSGFEIVGDHKQAYEARKVFDYYKDLVTELELDAVIDGSDQVGQAPFGVFVNLRHTVEIERESGGFGRYLQNQNTAQFSYNYGRPTENYREKFQEAAQQALQEHFEVLSVTFESDKVKSREIPGKQGWAITPYAYLLLKARGPQIDRLPPVRLDLDFLDTSGYAVLPIETTPVPIVASANAERRPARNVEVTQILDERQAKDGKLMLEVKATGHGLVPPLAELLDLTPPGFEIVKNDDPGVAVAKFAEDAAVPAVVSERNTMVTLRPKDGLTSRPKTFRFGAVKGKDIKAVYQRYADADLVAAQPETPLEQGWGTPSRWWLWITLGGVVLLGGAGIWLWRRPRPSVTLSNGLQLPSNLTPFTVIGLLREIERRNDLDAGAQQELARSIAQIEAGFFAKTGPSAPDLATVAHGWLGRMQPPPARE